MKTKNIIIAMAILTVVLTLVIVLCAFTSPDDSNEDGVIVVSAYYSDEALRLIAEKSFSAKFGARNMRRFIQTEVEDKLAEIIIADYNRAFTGAEIFAENGEIKVTCK